MAKTNEKPAGTQPGALQISRIFTAPRELVFRAWSSADHLQHWFCPAGYTVPKAKIEFRVGGAFHICMRSPQGVEHWSKGQYVEIVPHSRLVIDMNAIGEQDKPLFRAYTEVSFADEHGATRLEVRQSYTLFEPLAGQMIQGAAQGWAQTLDRLEQEVARMQKAESGNRPVVHAMFCIERSYAASPARVFKALTDPAAKAQWFAGGEDQTILVREMDARPGGRERVQGRWSNGLVTTFDAIYHDVVPDRRIVYSYEMHLDERKISVSLATFELKPAGSGTRVVMTEQGAFLDGYDDAGSREQGSGFLLDALGRSLAD